MNFKIPFSNRSHAYTKEEIDAVIQSMNDAIPLTQGKYLKEFEKKFCEYLNVNHSFGVNNATSALELAAQLCQFKNDEEVIIPLHTYTSSAYPFIKKGAKVVWCDIELETRVVSAKKIEEKITSKTKAIVVVHLYGYCANMPEIIDLAKKYNLLVIEDVAQAMGTSINEKKAGAFGDFGVFSFHSHKNMTTLGEGGMLTVKDNEIANLVPLLRHNGHCSFNFDRNDFWVPAMGNLDLPNLNGIDMMPNNYCIGEVESALGIKLLDRIDDMNNKKRERAIKFIDSLSDYDELTFHKVENNRHNYHLLVAQMKDGLRDKFIRHMANEMGIQCAVQYYPLNRYDLYKKIGLSKADCPNVDKFFDNMVSLPFHHMLTDIEIDQVIKACKDTLNSIRNSV